MHEGTSLQQDKDQDKDKSLTTKAISLISRRSVTIEVILGIPTIVSNSYAALDDESKEEVENVFDEAANLLNSTKAGANSSTYTVADG
ncbi:hypothetical protein Tco_1199352 [Tanacetum coccineum]